MIAVKSPCARLFACLAVATASLTLVGCGPRDAKSCVADATTRPTDVGVRVAMAECAKAFPPPANPFDKFDQPTAAEESSASAPTPELSSYQRVVEWAESHEMLIGGTLGALLGLSFGIAHLDKNKKSRKPDAR